MAIVTSTSSGNLLSSNTDPRVAGTATLGELLKHARENRGLTLERIASETRIPRRHLEALEHDDVTGGTAGFYQRAEIRAYAQAVGLDREVLRVAMRSFEAPHSSREAAQGKRATRLRTFGLIALGVVVTVVVIGRAVSPSEPPTGVGGETVSPSIPVPVAPDGAPPDFAGSSRDASEPVAQAATAAFQGTTERPEIPAPATVVTELVVTTQPAGARVTVNGIGWGVTPLTIRHLPPGDKRIRVSKEGYASQERAVRLDQGTRQALDIQLESGP